MSFVFLISYLICVIIRPQDWVPGFMGISLIHILATLTFIFLAVEQFSQKKLGVAKVPQNLLILGLYFCIIMSHVVNTYLGGMIEAFNSFFVIFVLFFILLNGANNELKFKISVWVMVIVITVLVFQGMYQIQNGYGWAGQDLTIQGLEREEPFKRINWIGIFNDPNDLALLFVIGVGLVIAFLFGPRGYTLRLTSIGLLALLLYGIYLTNSRGGVLALMATVYFFFVKRTRKFLIGGIIGGILAFLVMVFGPSRITSISINEASAFSRVELWYQGILMMKSSPLFGVGYGMFTNNLPQTAHNSFILAGAELGLLGLFFWMSLIYSSYKGLSIVQANDSRLYSFALGLQSSLVGFCAAAFFLSRTYVILPFILFALSGAAMYVAQQKNPNLNFKFTRKDMWMTVWLSLGSLLSSYMIIKLGL